MSKKVKVVSTLSRKAKINILAVMFLIFITITVYLSINQVSSLIEKREKIVELEERLSWLRNENIRLLAEEKSLYGQEGIEREARSQFNMTRRDEYNYFLVTEEEIEEKPEQETLYSNSNLWENIKIFYHQEIKE
ncbi:MAG: FtsB family cell division protein [Actinomycetota bacterium]